MTSPNGPLYSSTFIFRKRQLDAEFHRLDQLIARAARETPGYLGEESWQNPETGIVSNVYYWDSLGAMQRLMADPAHLQAKARHKDWFAGYRVVIAKVMRAYGNVDELPGVVSLDAPALHAAGAAPGTRTRRGAVAGLGVAGTGSPQAQAGGE